MAAMSRARTGWVLPWLLFAVACPREVDVPDVPPSAQRCETQDDCNDAACGLLRACVQGICEAADAGSLPVPCP
jgi:hypothetical protein